MSQKTQNNKQTNKKAQLPKFSTLSDSEKGFIACVCTWGWRGDRTQQHRHNMTKPSFYFFLQNTSGPCPSMCIYLSLQKRCQSATSQASRDSGCSQLHRNTRGQMLTFANHPCSTPPDLNSAITLTKEHAPSNSRSCSFSCLPTSEVTRTSGNSSLNINAGAHQTSSVKLVQLADLLNILISQT